MIKIFHPNRRQTDIMYKNNFPLWKVLQCWHCFASVYSFESWQQRKRERESQWWGLKFGADKGERERERSFLLCAGWSLGSPAMINITRQTQTTACTVQPVLTLIYLEKNRFKVQTKALLEVIGPSPGLFLIINALMQSDDVLMISTNVPHSLGLDILDNKIRLKHQKISWKISILADNFYNALVAPLSIGWLRNIFCNYPSFPDYWFDQQTETFCQMFDKRFTMFYSCLPAAAWRRGGLPPSLRSNIIKHLHFIR